MLMRKTRAPLQVVGVSHGRAVSSAAADIALPTGAQDGDHLLCFAFAPSTSTTDFALGGFSVISDQQGASLGFNLLSKVASGDGAGFTLTGGGTSGRRGIIIALRGGIGAVDVIGTISRGSSTSNTANSVTASADGILLGVWCHGDSNRGISSPPAGMLQLDQDNGTAMSLGAYSLDPSLAGASGTKSATWTFGNPNASILVQVK